MSGFILVGLKPGSRSLQPKIPFFGWQELRRHMYSIFLFQDGEWMVGYGYYGLLIVTLIVVYYSRFCFLLLRICGVYPVHHHILYFILMGVKILFISQFCDTGLAIMALD